MVLEGLETSAMSHHRLQNMHILLLTCTRAHVGTTTRVAPVAMLHRSSSNSRGEVLEPTDGYTTLLASSCAELAAGAASLPLVPVLTC